MNQANLIPIVTKCVRDALPEEMRPVFDELLIAIRSGANEATGPSTRASKRARMDDALRLYSEGVDVNEIAEVTGLSKSSVYVAAHRRGVPRYARRTAETPAS